MYRAGFSSAVRSTRCATEPDDPRFGPVGRQVIEDTGPLDRKRMETIDDDIAASTVDYITGQHEAGTPFFVWIEHHAYARVHAHQAGEPRAGRVVAVGVPRHRDGPRPQCRVRCWTALDELGIAEDTIVIYSTDNGPHRNSWPDAGTTPFRSEKDTNWEGASGCPK